MGVAQIVIGIVQMLFAIAIIIMVLFQHGKQTGLSGSIAGGAETFFGKQKGRSIDEKLAKWTTVVAAVFVVLTLLLCGLELAR